ncbi:Sec1 family protein, partial [Ostertagia ostertagi]
MDVLGTARAYIKEMVNLAGPPNETYLALHTILSDYIVSCAFAQSEMMQKEVYLFERLDSSVPREPIKHLKCLVFVRPTPDNVQLLSTELRNPRYAQYYIYFSNIVSKTDLKALAEADEHEAVREVHEFFVDGIALSAPLFSVNLKHIYDQTFNVTASSFLRIKQALVALLLSQKKKPLIRYQRSSEDCKRLAEDLNQVMRREEGLFDNAKRDAVLLIVDRSEDPVTPLLNQWTYEAMVHELITINNNRVTVDGQRRMMPCKSSASITTVLEERLGERVQFTHIHKKDTAVKKERIFLFGEGSTMGMTKRFIKGLKGVENIYTQHEPYLKDIVENTVKGRLSEQQYPYVSGDVTGGRQENLIVFIVGGATFEEALFVRSQNEKRMQGGGGPSITLATTFMHNTT